MKKVLLILIVLTALACAYPTLLPCEWWLTSGEEDILMLSVFADTYYIFALAPNDLYIWNYDSWDLVTTLTEPNSAATGGVYADSYYLYAGAGKWLHRWNNDGAFGGAGSSNRGKAINSIYGDGDDYLFAAYADGNIERFNRADFNTSTVLSNPGSTRYDVFVDSYYIYAADGDKQIYVWNDSDLTFLTSFSPQSESNWAIESAAMTAVHADNYYLFAGNANAKVYEFYLDTFAYKTRKDFATETITGIFADPLNRYYYASSEDNNVYVYDTDWWNVETILNDGADDMNDVYVDTEYIFGACSDGKVYIWAAEHTPTPVGYKTPIPTPTPTPTPTPNTVPYTFWWLEGDEDDILLLSVFADTYYIFALTAEDLYVWDYSSWNLLTTLTEPSGTTGGVYADSYYLYAGAGDWLYRWNNDGAFGDSGSSNQGKAINNIYGDGTDYIYAAYEDGNTERFNRADFNTSTVLSNAGSTRYDVFVAPYYIYAADGDKQIYVWNESNLSFITAFSPQSASNWATESAAMTAVHADSYYLFAGNANDNVYEFYLDTFDYKTRKDFATETITAIFADPIGRYYYASSEDNNVYVYTTDWWNVETILTDGADDMNDVCADTEYIFGACSDGKVYVWVAEHTPSPTSTPTPYGYKTPTPTPTPSVTPFITILIDEGFDDFHIGTRPAGWIFVNCNSNSDTYTTGGNHGKALPSLKLDSSDDSFTTETFTGPKDLYFWIKGQGVDDTSALLVEEYYGLDWHEVTDISDLPAGGTAEGPFGLNTSTVQLQFSYTKSVGNLALDDVRVTAPTPTPPGGGREGYRLKTLVSEPIELPPTTPVTAFEAEPESDEVAPEPKSTAAPLKELLLADPGDYDGDGTVDPAVFRPASGLWTIRGSRFVNRLYYGSASDLPASGDYDGDGSTDVAIYRSGLWAIRLVSRIYYGGAGDQPVPADYDGDGVCDIAVFRPDTGLWAIKGLTRLYFGISPAGVRPPAPSTSASGSDPHTSDIPIPGDYDGDGSADIAIFRSSTGLWKIKDITLFYLGTEGDIAIPGDYDGSGLWTAGIFRPASGLWAIRGITRSYFGTAEDQPVPGDYNGDLADNIAIFRPKIGLWAVKSLTHFYLSPME